MHIGTSSEALKKMIGENVEGNPVVKSLGKKLDLMDTSAIHRAAFIRDICCIERLNDISIIIAVTRREKQQFDNIYMKKVFELDLLFIE